MTRWGNDQNGPSPKRPQWRSKTAHANQNGPDRNGPNGRKNKTKTAQLTSKTAHPHVQNGLLRNIVQISDNDVINLNAHVAFRINASMPPPSSRHIAYDGHEKPTPLFPVEALRSRHERTPTMQLQPFHRRIWVHPTIQAYPNATSLPLAVGFVFML